ncbi:MAG: hypothetical protein ABSF83_02295 [Nitrososphaerales archaeon]
MRLRTVATAVGFLDGVWLVYAGWLWFETFFVPVLGPSGAPEVATSTNPELLGLGVVLVLVSFFCFLGWTKAFYASAILSALGILDVVVAGPSPSSPYFEPVPVLFSVLLGSLTVASGVVAARRRTFVPEEDHPLNLPVFG